MFTQPHTNSCSTANQSRVTIVCRIQKLNRVQIQSLHEQKQKVLEGFPYSHVYSPVQPISLIIASKGFIIDVPAGGQLVLTDRPKRFELNFSVRKIFLQMVKQGNVYITCIFHCSFVQMLDNIISWSNLIYSGHVLFLFLNNWVQHQRKLI